MSPSAHPVGGIDYPRTYQEFRSWFPEDEACREYLARLRWPSGFSCPKCDGDQCWLVGRGLRMCVQCSVKTSVIRRGDLPPLPLPALDVVRGGLVCDVTEGWRLCPRPARRP